MPKIIFSVTDEQKALYVEGAYSERVSLSEWVRRAADARLSPLELRPDDRHEQAEAAAWAEDEANRSSTRPRRRDKDGMCEHRVPTGMFCKKCGA